MRPIQWLGVLGIFLPGILMAGPQQADGAPAEEGSATMQNEPAENGPESEAASPAESEDEGQSVEEESSQPPSQAQEAASSTEKATAVVAKLNQTLLEIMRRAKALGYSGRYQLLEPVVEQVYDFSAISRYVLGSHWSRLTKEEKETFIAKMTEYGIASYAAQFDDYANEQFNILSEEPFRTRFRVVRAMLEVPEGEDVEFVYILRPTREGWKIIDVRYDGVSDLALKRGQFADILAKEGFDRLLAKLDEKIDNYAKGGKEG
ncbi:ABC transporter substrate-binding protein [Methylohalobius crimeensis]|uniref:ABC transporter substrate-binding protein n=1 Tax=Methylohalobius crimeensis TaxID=244365 RepID=UPI0003B3987D|nr:ABC transporter substrate-binding protein [Methylohalobius crimeensis]